MSRGFSKIGWGFSVLLGAVFVYAGGLKVKDPTQFLFDVRSFNLLPDPLAAWLALLLPWVEILAGLAVITGWLRAGGLLLLNALLIVFLGVIALSWMRGLDISCGCFGGSPEASDYMALVIRDLVLLAAGGVCWFWHGRLQSGPAQV